MESADSRLAHWIVNQRWWLIVITTLVVRVSASGMLFITIDSDLRVFFAKQDPRLVELEALENTYTKHESIILIRCPETGGCIYTTRPVRCESAYRRLLANTVFQPR
ncbi:MAG: hypothetical protein L0Z73_11270 [Gammaproteobacteria bacterium]|nr:hypothetical protein [Gammaproteobacteria bacterium]